MTPEEARLVENRISVLRKFGKAFEKEGPVLPSDPRHFRLTVWSEEIRLLVKERFSDNSALTSRISDTTGPITPRDAIELLDTLPNFIFVDAPSSASDSLKSLIEQSLREGYFNSWPFRLIIGAFGLTLALFFGGTVYLGLQVQSIGSQADAARHSIEAARDTVTTQTGQVVAAISDQAKKDADAKLADFQTRITNFDNEARALLKKAGDHVGSVGEAADQTQKAVDGAATTAGNNIKIAEESATKAVMAAGTQASKNVEAASSEAVRKIGEFNGDVLAKQRDIDERVTGAKGDIKKAVDQAAEGLPTAINLYLGAKKTDVDRMVSEGLSRQLETARTQIAQAVSTIDAQRVSFEHTLEIAQKELPQAAKLADIRAAAFTDALNRYSGPIDDIVGKLAGAKKLTTIELVAGVLGVAFWLALGAIAISLVALAVSVLRWRR